MGSTGGSNRAAHVFEALANRTAADVISAYGRRGVPRFATAIASVSSYWRRPAQIASTQLLPNGAWILLGGPVRAAVLDVHDHPGLQASALGVPSSVAERRRLDRVFDRNVAAFERLIAPSASFAELCQLPADRTIVISNGTDTRALVPTPPPHDAVVGMVSGAAPGRGIETLLDAMVRVRDEIPEANLRLALAATGPASAAYLRELTDRVRTREPWAELSAVPYGDLSAFLGAASVLVIPHPPGAYLDAATPVKLFDGMASGRPLAVTPRHETRQIIEANRAGVVATGDAPDDLAEAVLTLLRSEPLRHELGANGRRTAVERYDWRVLSAELADALLA